MSTWSGWALMNDSAAFFAAARRLGVTSVAVMLPETSMARMTVPEARDTGTDAAGPATAIARTATPAIVNHTPASRARPRPRPGPCPGLAAAIPAAARAAARRRAVATAAHARPAATSRPTARRTGLATLMRACAGCLRQPR